MSDNGVLLKAAFDGNFDVVKFLVGYGVDIETKDVESESASGVSSRGR